MQKTEKFIGRIRKEVVKINKLQGKLQISDKKHKSDKYIVM